MAPSTRQSGKVRIVSFRWAVDKQLRDAVCDFAGDSRHANPWAAELARMPRPTAGSADYTHEEIVCGRHIVREIWVRPGAGIKFPGIKQVFRIRRQVYDLSGQRLSKEYVHGVTSLDADRASAEQLLGLVRHHWRVEINHQIRDVAWREDHQHAYTGNGPRVMATIRT